jgi:hypothetical protein
MQKKLSGALLLIAACEPTAATLEVPRTDVTLDGSLLPSALTPMGVVETVGGSYPNAERATRSVTALVAACLRPMLEREPWLTGSLSVRWAVTRPEAMTVDGDLASFAAVACTKDALARAFLSEGATGSIVYSLEVRGTYVARDLDETATLDVDVVGLDASGPATQPPKQALDELGGTREKLQRCAFGATPALSLERWFVMGVGADGVPALAPTEGDDEATGCMQRALARARFPTEQRAYGLSVLVAPEGEGRAASVDRAEYGMIGLLNSGAGGDPDAPTAPWGRDEMIGVGDAFGVGGLGLRGTGQGGGGRGEGIGLGNVGTIGVGGASTGTGFGSGKGRLGGAHRTKPPTVKMGSTSVQGRLPPEVIQRIVRQNFGRFRLCYENGLRKDPSLAGKVTVSFEIARDGSTTKISAQSTLPDAAVVSCVTSAFKGLSYPQPEGGIVKVTYPIAFAPADAPPAATPAEPEAPPASSTVGGKRITKLSLDDLVARLKARSLDAIPVPGTPSPGVFVRGARGVHAVFVTEDGHPDSALTSCKTSDAGRALIVRGPQCEQTMAALLD